MIHKKNCAYVQTIAFVLPLVIIISGIFSSFAVSVEAAASDLDPTFGTGGKTTNSFLVAADWANALALQSDGKIVVAGGRVPPPPPFTFREFALARFNPDGSLDQTFGDGGTVITFLGQNDDVARAVAIQEDGKIVVGGFSANSMGKPRFIVLRYNCDGSLDSTFGTNGKFLINLGITTVNALAIQADGKIIAAGGASITAGWIGQFIVRLNPNGTLDASFGGYGVGKEIGLGIVLTPFTTISDAQAITLQPDGKILAGSGTPFKLARYNADGTPDTNFGIEGVATTNFTETVSSINALALQTDGRIVAAGQVSGDFPAPHDFALARYNSNGTRDKTFNGTGKVTTDFFGEDDVARALIVQPDGRLVAIGYASKDGNYDFAQVRYNVNGSLDSSFGTGGKATTDFDGGNDKAFSAALQSDGKTVVAGQTTSALTQTAIARYKGVSFDICLQDESNGNILQINSETGEYLFKNCAGTVIGGVGTITRRGSLLSLQNNASGHKLQATIDGNMYKATATLKILGQGPALMIIDKDITNNSGECR